MNLTTWDPFESIMSLQSEVDDLFHKRLKNGRSLSNVSADWSPAVDIHEDKESYYFDVEAPGLNKDQFDVKVEDNVLSIKGERQSSTEDKNKNFYRIERSYGSFMRSFYLPETADAEKVNAEYKNGVLHIKIGKKETAKPKKIDVNVV